jgi:Putative oxidoreductase C terminal domain
MPDVSLIVADPGHFHAALVQKEMYPNLSPDVHVYAPLGPDLADYLTRVARFNTRKEQPTHWKLEVHAGPDFLERMCRERLGTIAISSGRNRDKVRQIQAAIDAGINVLADKPVIIRRDELPVLEAALDAAEERGLILYDMSSGGRQQIIPCLTRLLCNDPDVFGDPVPGTRSEPGVKMESVHHIMKRVAGVPNLRPAWFFDVTQQGESLADVGTHLVDRAHSTLFPEQAIDYRTDIRVHEATPVADGAQQDAIPPGDRRGGLARLSGAVDKNGRSPIFLQYPVQYEIRGVQVALETRWDWEAEAGDDRRPAAIAAAASDWNCGRALKKAIVRSSMSCRPPISPFPSNTEWPRCRRLIRASV